MPSFPTRVLGYSDRINHALAYAAKHHDQQVRKGTRAPYQTSPANVAIILTRYSRDEDSVVAGILHDVVEDSLRDGQTAELLRQRIGEKFGQDVLDILLAATLRRYDDAGVELSIDERRQDLLDRLDVAGDDARWVCAAEKLHHAASLVADLRRTVDPTAVWARQRAGGAGTVQWYRQVRDRLAALGFDAPIVAELSATVAELAHRVPTEARA
jgi:(p)ppGpp synthase/HD superfamily hydrolase